MSRFVTVVMYHYVRDLERSRFPAIKGLSIARFCRQLDYIQARYTPISLASLLKALGPEEKNLPPNPILLTFDDGYSDHFTNVFPLLDARGIPGCFFPPARAVVEHRVLDVNKIQFVLAIVPDASALLDQVFSSLAEFRSEHALKTKEEYLLALTGEHRYDTREVTVLKRLLQRELPEPVRSEIVRRLFAKHVTSDETAFACELYMSVEQIACLLRHGMHIGSHGYAHAWLNHISPEAQASEIDRSLEFLEMLGGGYLLDSGSGCGVGLMGRSPCTARDAPVPLPEAEPGSSARTRAHAPRRSADRNNLSEADVRLLGIGSGDWSMCYPYGGFNDSLLQILRARQCRLGFTVEARIADLDVDDRLTLPRLDTNDLPS